MLLNWIVYYVRCQIVNPLESPRIASFKGRCAPAAQICDELLTRMGFTVQQFNMGSVVNAPNIHQLTMVYIPTVINGQNISKKYILDPTFRQFCICEENRFERYFEEPRFSVNMSTPRPGYFLNLSARGKEFANELITYGYFEITGMFIMNGNNTSEAAWKSNSRAKKISVIINNEEEYGFDLEDTMEVQLIDLNYRQDGIDTPINVEIKILDVYEGDVSDNVFISDIGFGLESSIKGGR